MHFQTFNRFRTILHSFFCFSALIINISSWFFPASWILTRLYFIHRTNRRSRSLGDVYQTRFYICLWFKHLGIDKQVVGVVVLVSDRFCATN